MDRTSELGPLRAAGLELIRIRARDKAPQDSGWRTLSVSHEEVAAHVRAGGNAGWRLGAPDLVVDVDPRNFAEGDDPLARLAEDAGFDPSLCPRVLTGGGGHHYYLTKPRDAAVLNSLDAYPGVEFKSAGFQVLVPGSIHPDTGNLYEWDDLAPPPSERPPAPDRLLALIARPDPQQGAGGGELTPEQVKACLDQVDPSAYRDEGEWRNLMMSCHDASRGEARAEFVAWSTSDPQYAGHGALIGRRWDSLHADRGARITYRTLYRAVLDAGGQIPQDSPESDFGSDPLEADPDDGRVSPAQARLAMMNERHCVVFDGALRIYTREYDPELGRYHYARYTRHDFENWYLNKRVQDGDDSMTLAAWWLRHPGRREYRGLVFDPGRETEGYLNLWQGFSVRPSRGRWDKFERLVRESICAGDEAFYDYAMRWLAHLCQRPGEPAEAALVMRGEKGTGKGTFAGAAMALVSAHAIQVSSAQQFTGRFNSHLRDCVLLFVDEAFWAGDHQAEGTLKRLITERTVVIEPKGVDARVARNRLSIMIASNNEWVVPAGLDGERRYAVTEVGNAHRGDRAFVGAVKRQLYEEGGLGGLFRHLTEDVDISGWHPREDIPQTRALAEQKIQGLSDVQGWWYARLLEGRLPGGAGDWNGAPAAAPSHTLHEHYVAETGGLNHRNRRASQITFGRQLSKLVPDYRTEQRAAGHADLIPVDTRGRARYIIVPPLGECRAFFDGQLGSPTDWGDDFLE